MFFANARAAWIGMFDNCRRRLREIAGDAVGGFKVDDIVKREFLAAQLLGLGNAAGDAFFAVKRG